MDHDCFLPHPFITMPHISAALYRAAYTETRNTVAHSGKMKQFIQHFRSLASSKTHISAQIYFSYSETVDSGIHSFCCTRNIPRSPLENCAIRKDEDGIQVLMPLYKY